jgi:hypothetical protein
MHTPITPPPTTATSGFIESIVRFIEVRAFVSMRAAL